ncbi:MAG: ABC transporter permease [Acidobacteria bacterium]|nr:ABC transporter permease [Acidobacteriota bacterium]
MQACQHRRQGVVSAKDGDIPAPRPAIRTSRPVPNAPSHDLCRVVAQVRSYKQVAAYTDDSFVVSRRGEPARIGGAMVCSSLFPVLGVRPALGRTLLPEDDRVGAEPVVVLSHDLWQRMFGARRASRVDPLAALRS